jgi:hypothetical protein
MTTFNWTLPTLERQTADGFVCVAHWRCTASDGDFSASSYGTAGFSQDPENFTPYEDLTEAQVLEWVWESVDKDATEAALAQKIEDQKHPTTAAGVPW